MVWPLHNYSSPCQLIVVYDTDLAVCEYKHPSYKRHLHLSVRQVLRRTRPGACLRWCGRYILLAALVISRFFVTQKCLAANY